MTWTAFPLHPETPEEGRTLEDLFAGRGVDVPAMLAHLRQTANQLGLPFGDRRMTFNSRRAQELGKWAETQGQGDAFHNAIFRAYFEKGQNIAQMEVLKSIAANLGLNSVTCENVLIQDYYKDAVDRDWQRARRMGITAVPTFHTTGRLLVGAQSYAELEKWVLDHGLAKPKL